MFKLCNAKEIDSTKPIDISSLLIKVRFCLWGMSWKSSDVPTSNTVAHLTSIKGCVV